MKQEAFLYLFAGAWHSKLIYFSSSAHTCLVSKTDPLYSTAVHSEYNLHWKNFRKSTARDFCRSRADNFSISNYDVITRPFVLTVQGVDWSTSGLSINVHHCKYFWSNISVIKFKIDYIKYKLSQFDEKAISIIQVIKHERKINTCIYIINIMKKYPTVLIRKYFLLLFCSTVYLLSWNSSIHIVFMKFLTSKWAK